MKYAWIAANRKIYSLAEMCTFFEVSVSGYRTWQRGGIPGRKRLTEAQMLAIISATHAELKGAYGSPSMIRELRLRGFTTSKQRVEL